MDINDLAEVQVRYNNGQEVVFRGKGLEKLRKMIKVSPPLRTVEPKKTKQQVMVVEESGSEEEESSEEKPRPKKTKSTPVNGGYNTVHLDYGGPKATDVGSGTKALSPYDLAKEMQRQASATSGVNY